MPKVVYVAVDGLEQVVQADVGESLMSAAVRHGVPGIIGECGGNSSCATCHVWVRPDFHTLVGRPGDFEDDLLDLGVEERRESSRLACQVTVTAELDGLVVDVPPEHL
ncbi:2Fe-2S iron-sulfur cluster-binding protein [Intrasporangium mesophilum]